MKIEKVNVKSGSVMILSLMPGISNLYPNGIKKNEKADAVIQEITEKLTKALKKPLGCSELVYLPDNDLIKEVLIFEPDESRL